MSHLMLGLAVLVFLCGHSAGTSKAIPDSWLGFYEIPDGAESLATNFATDAKGDIQDPFTRPDYVQLRKCRTEPGLYYWKMSFSPTTVQPIDFAYKLGEPQSKLVGDTVIEYTFTLNNDTTVLQGEFRIDYRTPKGAGQRLYKVEARFINGTLHACDVSEAVAKCQIYQKMPPPFIPGSYVIDQESANFAQVAGPHILPLPKDVAWADKAIVWIGKLENEYVFRYVVDLGYPLTFPVDHAKGEIKHIKLQGVPVEYFYNLTLPLQTPSTNVLSFGFTTPNTSYTGLAVFDKDGLNITYKRDGQEAFQYYKRVLPFVLNGLYENVPEHDDNWTEFLQESQTEDISQITMNRDEKFYKMIVSGLTPEKTFVIPFALEIPSEQYLPNGKIHKYIYTYEGRNQMKLRSHHKVGEVDFFIVAAFNASGLSATYKVNNVTAKRFYRRVLPKHLLGIYESNQATADFIAFTNKIGSPQLTKNTTIELSQTPDHVYHQIFKTEGVAESSDFPFVLGQPTKKTLDGKTLDYTYFYMDAINETPILRTTWREQGGGPLKFDVIGIYSPQGYTATYMFGDKIARRQYTRKMCQP